jgi:NDP-sugar pyrophosphorylase family protein
MIQDHLGDGSSLGVSISYSLDGPRQLGTGGAIKNALSKLGSEFGVIYGDSYLPAEYSIIEQRFLESKKLALMTIYKNENLFEPSNVEFLNGTLRKYQKGIKDTNMRHIDYGLTYFRDEAFRAWSNIDTFDLASLCHKLSIQGQIDGFEVNEAFFEIGSLEGIDRISNYLTERS